jgi:hypothetical protein
MRLRYLLTGCVLSTRYLGACSDADPVSSLSGAGGGGTTSEADLTAGSDVDETAAEASTPWWFTTADTAACPTGTAFDDDHGFCTDGQRALGPFTQAMIAACKSAGERGCDDINWPAERAARLRGEETCPRGAAIDPNLGVCVEGAYAFGPFDAPMIEECEQRGGTTCRSMRWETSWITPVPAEDAIEEDDGSGLSTQTRPSCGGLNERLYAIYTTSQGYSTVSRLGMRTLGTRKNGCATWLSHAIRQSGVQMPVRSGTERFRDELKGRGWVVIRNKEDLRPGDVIITKDRKGRPGHPDHVYMFAGWQDARLAIPIAVDNQGFTHARGPAKSPIAYGLRAPDSNDGPGCEATSAAPPPSSSDDPPQKDSCAAKSDGWYCSDLRDFSSYRCAAGLISGGWQCGDNTVCRKDSGGRATMYGEHPGCFGRR